MSISCTVPLEVERRLAASVSACEYRQRRKPNLRSTTKRLPYTPGHSEEYPFELAAVSSTLTAVLLKDKKCAYMCASAHGFCVSDDNSLVPH